MIVRICRNWEWKKKNLAKIIAAREPLASRKNNEMKINNRLYWVANSFPMKTKKPNIKCRLFTFAVHIQMVYVVVNSVNIFDERIPNEAALSITSNTKENWIVCSIVMRALNLLFLCTWQDPTKRVSNVCSFGNHVDEKISCRIV